MIRRLARVVAVPPRELLWLLPGVAFAAWGLTIADHLPELLQVVFVGAR